MASKDEARLQEAGEWDFDNAKAHPPIRGRRAIVSVAFPASDFATVSRAAQAMNMRLSEFIRMATLEKADQKPLVASMVLTGVAAQGEATFLFESMGLSTRGQGLNLAAT